MNFRKVRNMSDQGNTYFKIYRKLFENGLWSDPICLRLFLWILGHAVYEPKGLSYSAVKVKRGQYLRSYRKLQEDLEYVHNRQVKQYPLMTISRAVDKLVQMGIITKLETELGTLFTILNYEKYQSIGTKNEGNDERFKQPIVELDTELGTTCEQPDDNNKKGNKVKYLYSPNSAELRLANLLFGLIRERNPKHKLPNLQIWAKHINYLIRIDNRSTDEIERVIRWSQKDSFWQNNILSTDKLRKQFDHLCLKMQKGEGSLSSSSTVSQPYHLNNFNISKQTGV